MCGGKSQSRVRACSSSNGSPVPLYDEDTGCQTGYSGCSGPYASSCGDWGQWSDIETCPSFQVCQAQTSPPSCACSGTCYPAPTLKPVNEVGQNVLGQEQKIKLPVKLDWEGPTGIEPCAIDSYQYRVAGDSAIENSVTNPEVEMKNCALNSNSSYDWQARACLQGDCGKWSDQQNFSTSLAPEPLSPYDPDWEKGAEKAEGISLPVKLDWCDVKEAQSYRFRAFFIENGQEICHPVLQTGNECDAWLLEKERRDPEAIEKTIFSDFIDEDFYFFTKDTVYRWEMLTCTDNDGLDCGEPSQRWNFTAAGEVSKKITPLSPPNDPAGEKPAGFPLILDWVAPLEMKSFIYQVDSITDTATVSQSKSFNYPRLLLNAFYKWKVRGCWDYKAENCEPNFSEEWVFKTTGQPPKLVSPAAGATDVVIPVNFDWEGVSGAKSYVFKIQGSGLILEKPTAQSEFSLDYPDLKMSADYSWQVKTCAGENGQTCGAYSDPQNFKTFKLSPPSVPEAPQNGGVFLTDEHYLTWEKINGAKAYQYQIKLLSISPEEKSQNCSAPPLKTVSINSDYVELACLGQYQWQTQSCLDQNCAETSDWSNAWTFTLSEGGATQGGLVPCGRKTDNPNTPWNEREPCQIKHVFLLVKTMIDFILLRLIPLGLVLLTIYSGVIFYLSLGKASSLAQVISLWKSVGIGLVITFFAWLIVNIVLKLIGYQISIFGNWHIII